MPPKTGHLALPPIIEVTCATQGSDALFRGDPGSIYMVKCPESCNE